MESMQTEVNKALEILKKGGTLLYPTDTVWGLGCDATDEDAVKKIYRIKQREESKSLIILVSSFEMLQAYIPVIPEQLSAVLSEADRPTTVIYNDPVGLAKNVVA